MVLYNQLTSQYLLDLFPELQKEINAQVSFLGEELPHCIYADVLNPFLRRYFKTPDPNDEGLVERIFDFYEVLAKNGDSDTKCLLEVSLLEPLWDNKESYIGALRFMKDETRLIFDGLSAYLNLPE